MRQRPPRYRMLAAFFATVTPLLFLVPAASAQLRGGSQALDQPPVTTSDVEAMARIAELSESQREAVRGMVEVTLAEFEASLERFNEVQEGFREDMRERRGDPELMVTLLEKVTEFRRYRDGLREDLFEEIEQLVLREEQLERWPAFERHHRRQRIDEIDTGAVSGGSVDLIALVEDLELGAELEENLAGVLDRYAKELDEVIRRRIEMADEFSEEQIEVMRENGSNFMAAMPTYERMFEEAREQVLRARAITERYQRLVAQALEGAAQREFVEAFNEEFVPRVYASSRAERVMEQAAGLESLSEEQTAQLAELRERYEREARPINERWAEALLEHEAESMTMMESFGPGGVQNEDVVEASRARRDLDDRYIDRVRALLSEEQLSELPEPPSSNWRDATFGG